MKSVLSIIGIVLLLISMANAEQYVQVDYSGQSIAGIVDEVSKTLLLVYINITNNGYDSVSTNPYNFQVEINKVKYNFDWVSYSLDDVGLPKLDSVDLGDGGQTSGYLAFTIPANAKEFALIFDPDSSLMNVKYNTSLAEIKVGQI